MSRFTHVVGIFLFLGCDIGKNQDPGGVITEQDLDGDGLVGDADCDPMNANVGDGLDELCDGIDNDCDGIIDEDPIDGSNWYSDGDGDGYGTENNIVTDCEQPSGYTDLIGDCDDLNSSINPEAAEVCDGIDNDCDGLTDDEDEIDGSGPVWGLDSDGDGYGDAENTILACEQPSGYVDNIDDCSDLDANTFNGAAFNESETDCMTDADGDGYGDPDPSLPGVQAGTDCDDTDANTYIGAAYNDDPTLCATDADGDGYGDWLPGTQIVQAGSDCDDNNPNVNIEGIEICGDGLDNDCDGNTDDSNATDALTWYLDSDGDGYGDTNISIQSCVQVPGYVTDNTDCDDTDDGTFVGAATLDDPNACMSDSDGDGFGDSTPGNPNVTPGTDCDDNDANTYEGAAFNDDPSACMSDSDGDGYGDVNPSVPGVQSGTDCDDSSSNAFMGAAYIEAPSACMVDSDGDGYGNATPSNPNVDSGSDCDDTQNTVNPGALEQCDALDNDCNGLVDDNITSGGVTWYADLDGDGYGNNANSILVCTPPNGYVLDNTDCDDTDANTFIGAASNDGSTICSTDSDGDGYGDANPSNPGVTPGTDCNDSDTLVSPGEDEICDGIDNNCDGLIDDNGSVDILSWFFDGDGDGYGDASNSIQACFQPSGHVSDSTDCDDSNADTYLGAATNDDPTTCTTDSDGDGYGDANPTNPNVDAGTDCDDSADATFVGAAYNDDPNACMTDLDGDGYGGANPTNPNVTPGTDCNDNSDECYPGASEICDNLDNDCNGQIDEGVTNGTFWYLDSDSDGYGDPNTSVQQCGQPSGYVSNNSDCDDSDANTYIGAAINDVPTSCTSDADGDGYGDANPTNPNIDPGSDCNDSDANTHVGAAINDDPALCTSDSDGDGFGDANPTNPNIDPGTDCDDSDANAFIGAADLDDPSACMTDADDDGYGDTSPTNPNVTPGFDCNDGNSSISPVEDEVCDGIDNDCDGLTDDSSSVDILSWFFDGDNDGYGNASDSVQSCAQPSGYVPDNTDCDDSDANAHVGAAVNDPQAACTIDLDGDGYGDANPTNPNVTPGADCDDGNSSVSPAEDEVCDGIDNNCDGLIDDGGSTDALTWYMDADNDGFGAAMNSVQDCAQPSGYVADNTDCDDANANAFIGAAALEDPTACTSDTDGDGYGDANPTNPNVDPGSDCDDSDANAYVGAASLDDPTACTNDSDGDGYGDATPSNPNVTPGTDCDDSDADTFIGAATLDDPTACTNDSDGDGYGDATPVNPNVDAGSDCDDSDANTFVGAASLDDPAACMTDSDGDDYGDSNPTNPNVTPGTDCNDSDDSISPAATEVCDSIDNDCDALTDDADNSVDPSTAQLYYQDGDGDGYGDPGISLFSCDQPTGYVTNDDDCDDDPNTGIIAAPNVAETCDFVDNNCDGTIDAPGTVAFFPTGGGLPVDLTADFTGTSSQPATPLLNTAGTIVLCDGSYYVNMTVQNDIVLSPNGSVTLDGADTGTIVNIDQSGIVFEASDVTFFNGNGNVEIVTNYPTSGGGIACFGYSDVILDNVEFSYNVGDLGGAIISIACNLEITNSTFEANTAVYGGGIYAVDGTYDVSNTDFDSNYASIVGGGAVFGQSNTPSTFNGTNLLFVNNESPYGGGLNVQELTSNLTDSTFSHNYGHLGGGLNVLAGDFTGTDLLFEFNSATAYGGAAAIGAEISSDVTVSAIYDSTFQYNNAPNGAGIIYLEGQNILEDSEVISNTASSFGGGLFVGDQYDDTLTYTDNHLDLVNTYVSDNNATYGAGMYVRFEATARCESTFGTLGGFHNNVASLYGGAVYLTNDVIYTGETCDMGLSSTDNAPNDVSIELSNTIGDYNYADNATFTCDGNGCVP